MMGEAVAQVLSGKVSPTGRSPFTWPTGLSQLPDELDMSPSSPPGRTYRYLRQTPLYSFGYGLSYGRISYRKASVAPEQVHVRSSCGAGLQDCGQVTVCAEVANEKEASFATEEVVQVYAQPDPAKVKGASVPKLLLLGFARTGELQPGDAATVCLPIELADLRLMGSDGAPSSFGLLPGAYGLIIGGAPPGPNGAYVPPGTLPRTIELQLTVGA